MNLNKTKTLHSFIGLKFGVIPISRFKVYIDNFYIMSFRHAIPDREGSPTTIRVPSL